MALRKFYGALLACTLVFLVVGCSSGSSSNPPSGPISVSFLTAPPSSLATGATTGLVAQVTNDNTGAGVSWTVSCGGSSCGSISPSSTGNGQTTTYTAPSTVPSPATVTITATSVADTTKAASATVTITSSGAAISVAFASQPPSSLAINATTSIAAIVTNDLKNAGVTWTVTCGSSSCGSFNPTNTASNAATTYTAPSAVPSPATVTVIATSVTDKTKSASATITITGSSTSIIADGNYVLHVSGQDLNGPYFLVGAFNVKSGAITGGEQDFSDPNIGSSDALVPAQSSIISTGSGNNIQIVLATANTQIGVNGSETIHGTFVSNTRMLISEFDAAAAATGSLDLQTTATAPSGGFAFSMNGNDDSSNNNQISFGGVLNFTGATLSTLNSVFDIADGDGTVLTQQTFSSGSVSAPDTYGRVTVNLTPSTASNVPTIALSAYIVDGHTIQIIESQGDGLNADMGGTALAQGANANNFSTASISGSTYVHGSIGSDSVGSLILGGSFVFGAGNTASGQLAFNDLENITPNSFSGASYQVSSTGRVAITNVIPSSLSNITLTFIMYLDGSGNAMIMGADDVQQSSGLAYQQTATPTYQGNYALAVQGSLVGPVLNNGEVITLPYGAAGPVAINSSAITGFTDYTSQDANPPNFSPFDTYSNATLSGQVNSPSTGNLSVTGLNSFTTGQAGQFGYYPIDSSRLLAIELDENAQGLLVMESSVQPQQ
ncbi:MAG: hypothetical protein ABSA39_17625 [Edaphobacter sp.]